MVYRFCISAAGHHVTFSIDEEIAFAPGEFEKLDQDTVDLIQVFTVENEALIS